MVWIRAILTVMMSDGKNITQNTNMELDYGSCPSTFKASHYACTYKNCYRPDYLKSPSIDLNHEICAKKELFCTSPECLNAATNIQNAMGSNADPCDDFYDFACGSFEKTTRIPDDKQLVNVFTFFEDNLRDQIMSVLTTPSAFNSSLRFQITKHFYELCKSTDTIAPNTDGYKATIDKLIALGKNFGGFPLLDSNWKPMNWRDIVSNLFKKGLSAKYFVGMDLEQIERFPGVTSTILRLGYPSFLLPSTILVLGLEDERVKAYLRLMNKVILMFGAPLQKAQLDVGEILAFEIMLASMTNTPNLPKQGYFTFSSLNNEKFEWVNYVNKITSPEIGTFHANDTVFVEDMNFLDQIQTVLEVNGKAQTIQNYVMWRVMLEVLPYLPPEFRKQLSSYETTLFQKELGVLSSEENCAKITILSMPELVGAVYIDKYFDKKKEQDVRKIIDNIRESYVEAVRKLEWMEEVDRSYAINVIQKLRSHVAYPIERLNETHFDEWYKDWQINYKNAFFEIVLENNKIRTNQKYKEYLFQSGIWIFGFWDKIWDLHKAFYIPQVKYMKHDNSLDVSATILQADLYNLNRPVYMNYAALGIMIAHEIAHHYHPKHWRAKTLDQYLEKSKCFVEQYGSIMVPKIGVKLNGEQTLKTNIGDQASMKIAYYAYKNWTKAKGHDKTLPGFEKYTQNQMFWLSAARSFCEVYRLEEMAPLVYFGDVTPARYRVNTAFSNLKEFIADYKCPLGTNMNPVNKCEMW